MALLSLGQLARQRHYLHHDLAPGPLVFHQRQEYQVQPLLWGEPGAAEAQGGALRSGGCAEALKDN